MVLKWYSWLKPRIIKLKNQKSSFIFVKIFTMEVNEALVDRLALLSKLSFDKEEKEKLIVDLGNILNLVDKLNEVDTSGVNPLVYMNGEMNILREDVIVSEITKEEALKNAPQKDSDYFKVPKMIQ